MKQSFPKLKQNLAKPAIQSKDVTYKEKKQKKKQLYYKKKTFSKKSMGNQLEDTKNMIEAFIGSVAQAPMHLVDNEFIKRGYRIGYNQSIKSILKSLFQFHNESVNVWSHLFGTIFFITMIVYTFIKLSNMKDMGSFVWNDFHQSQQDKQHISSYFQHQLLQVEQDINYYYQDILDSQNETESDKTNDDWGYRFEQAIHRIEGLAMTFVSEFQTFKHYIEEEETILEEKFHEWKEHAQHYPEELKEKILQLQEIMQQKLANSSGYYFSNETYSRLGYLKNTMDHFQNKMYDFQSSLLDRIDQMDWLEVVETGKPIEDIDSYLNHVPRWPLFVNMISAVICLGISSVYHLFFVYSPSACSFLAKLDYTGITILIFGSTVPGIQYMFACGQVIYLRRFFLILVGGSCSAVFIVCMLPVFNHPQYKWLRGGLFTILGASVSAPLFYIRSNYDPELMLEGLATQYLIGGAVYVLGASLYMTRVPERCKPGTFDMCGHSHQLFHFCVVIACGIHYFENLMCYYRRQQFTCPHV